MGRSNSGITRPANSFGSCVIPKLTCQTRLKGQEDRQPWRSQRMASGLQPAAVARFSYGESGLKRARWRCRAIQIW
jgi:hypothetical protein